MENIIHLVLTLQNFLTARIIVATHKDLDKMKDDDTFRKDLYYRLKAHHVHIPPLRERKEDIPILISHFLNTASEA